MMFMVLNQAMLERGRKACSLLLLFALVMKYSTIRQHTCTACYTLLPVLDDR